MNRQHRRLAGECADLRERLVETEERVEQLQNTLQAVAREAGIASVTHPCRRCEQSLLLVRDGRIYCPSCRYGRSV